MVFLGEVSVCNRSPPASPATPGVFTLARMPTALVIIDMQMGMRARTSSRNNPNAEQEIAGLLAVWRVHQAPVVHVRHISRTPGSPFWPGQVGAEFQPEFAPLEHEHIVEKNVPDAFIHSGLERWFHVRGIQQLVIVGVSTNNSVESTARSAGNLGFKTWVVSDATFTFDKDDYNHVPRSAEDVHAMALANLDGEYATIAPAREIIQLFGHPETPVVPTL